MFLEMKQHLLIQIYFELSRGSKIAGKLNVTGTQTGRQTERESKVAECTLEVIKTVDHQKVIPDPEFRRKKKGKI